MDNLRQEIEKRRTFAIISHPDAGKTTLTDCDSMCIYKLYGRLIGHEELFVSGIFFHGNDIFNAKGAVQEVL